MMIPVNQRFANLPGILARYPTKPIYYYNDIVTSFTSPAGVIKRN